MKFNTIAAAAVGLAASASAAAVPTSGFHTTTYSAVVFEYDVARTTTVTALVAAPVPTATVTARAESESFGTTVTAMETVTKHAAPPTLPAITVGKNVQTTMITMPFGSRKTVAADAESTQAIERRWKKKPYNKLKGKEKEKVYKDYVYQWQGSHPDVYVNYNAEAAGGQPKVSRKELNEVEVVFENGDTEYHGSPKVPGINDPYWNGLSNDGKKQGKSA